MALADFLATYRKRAHLTDPVNTRYGHRAGASTGAAQPLRSAFASAQRTPQAVFKVLSKLAGIGGIAHTLQYISRGGALALETAGAEEHLLDKTDIAALLNSWRATFTTRANGVDAVHLMLSSPAGADRDAVLRAARAFCADQFPDRDYALVRHDDTGNPHVHVVVQHRNAELEPLTWCKAELIHYREAWAHHCRARGIDVSASYRAERGVYDKGLSMAQRRIKARGAQLHRDARPPKTHFPFLKAQIDRAAAEARRFREYAEWVRKTRRKGSPAAAALLEAHARHLHAAIRDHAGQLLGHHGPAPPTDREPGD